MRKLIAMILAMVMLFTMCSVAAADGTGLYLMAGYDSADSNHDWESNAFFSRMAEITGISFAYEQYKDYDAWSAAKAALLDGSDNMPDVLFKAQLTAQETMRYYENGVLIDLKPYLAQYAPALWTHLQENPAVEKAITLPDGAIVALPTINDLPNNNAAWINTEWLKKVGKAMPTTVDELTDVLRAFRDKDPNSNGQADEIPITFTGLWDLRYLAQAFGIVTNDYSLRVTDGKVICMADSAENRAFLEWLHMLWEEKLIDHHGFSSTDTMRQITDEKTAVPYGIVFGATALNLVPASIANNYTVLMPLSVNGTAGSWRSLQGDVVRGTFAVTSHCDHPEKVLAWVDYLYSENGDKLMQAGINEEDYFFNEDGTWEYVTSGDELSAMLATQTIVGGGDVPGWFSADFQLKFNDAATHHAVEQLYALHQVSEFPFPLIWETEEELNTIAGIWEKLGPYMETTMAHFVTGDEELNDQTWSAFTASIHEMGMDQLVEIWQNVIDR